MSENLKQIFKRFNISAASTLEIINRLPYGSTIITLNGMFLAIDNDTLKELEEWFETNVKHKETKHVRKRKDTNGNGKTKKS